MSRTRSSLLIFALLPTDATRGAEPSIHVSYELFLARTYDSGMVCYILIDPNPTDHYGLGGSPIFIASHRRHHRSKEPHILRASC